MYSPAMVTYNVTSALHLSFVVCTGLTCANRLSIHVRGTRTRLKLAYPLSVARHALCTFGPMSPTETPGNAA